MGILSLVGSVPSAKPVPKFQRKTAFKVYSSTGQSLSAGVPVKLNWTAALYDLGNNFNLTTDQYVVPYQGLYQYNVLLVNVNTPAAATYGVTIAFFSQLGQVIVGDIRNFKNAVVNDQQAIQCSGSHVFSKDDQLEVRAASDVNTTLAGSATGALFFWSMYRVETESRTVL